MITLPLLFRAHVITGSGRGKSLGTPTMNLLMEDVPDILQTGIYACRADVGSASFENAVLHYGPRPVFKDTDSCEVHLLDRTLVVAPQVLDVEVVAYIREVRDFPSPEALGAQIASDIAQARAILAA